MVKVAAQYIASAFDLVSSGNGKFHWAFGALYIHSSGWLDPAEASENQFNLV